jgi:hypothetical protein
MGVRIPVFDLLVLSGALGAWSPLVEAQTLTGRVHGWRGWGRLTAS